MPKAVLEKVVMGYKRYLYLTTVSKKPVCPSEAVDDFWHFHIGFGQQYREYCEEMIGQELMHSPSGGRHELEKHKDMYEFTLGLFAVTFGSPPGEQIWPPVEERFSVSEKPVYVNLFRTAIVRTYKKLVGPFSYESILRRANPQEEDLNLSLLQEDSSIRVQSKPVDRNVVVEKTKWRKKQRLQRKKTFAK